jgi:hypothetical protein
MTTMHRLRNNQGNNPFTIASKTLKCLRIIFTKESKDVYNENYKQLKR